MVFLGLVLVLPGAEGDLVTLHLRNGDRLTGELVSEAEDHVVLTTPWSASVTVPRAQIMEQVPVPSPEEQLAQDKANALDAALALAAVQQVAQTAAVSEEASAAKPGADVQPKRPQNWKWNLRLGTDFLQGAKDRKIYFGQTALTYTKNYDRDPREFLRNRLEYRVDYAETDGRISANRMVGVNKLDVDIGRGYYGYLAAGAGYDRVRKIEYEYDAGPGVGYHLLAKKSLALDGEVGLNYQFRRGLADAPDREILQARLGQELAWEVMPKIMVTQQLALLPFLDEPGEYQVRFEGNLGFGIVQHLSLNLTVRNLYDTQPAPGVPNNEFQFRSSVGVTF